MDGQTVVIGGGVIGLSCAWRLAADGTSVTVVDPDPARGASWAAAGMLAPVTELHYGEEALLRFNLAAQARWPSHAAALAEEGVDVGYLECGSLLVARDADDAAELRRLLSVQRSLGMQVEWLRSRELRALEPNVAPSVRGGILVAGDHQVDNRALVAGLLSRCEAHRSVEVVRGRAVALEGGEVVLGDGHRIGADVVVLAAGARSGKLRGIDLAMPVRPVKGQLVHLHSPDGPLARRNLRGEDCYIVSRPDGRVVVGATMEEQGFDDRPSAGAVRDLLDAAWELLPGIAEATFVGTAVGFRPASPDNAPLLGPLAGHVHPRVVVATGHFRNGVLQSPLTAEAVSAWVRQVPPPPDVAGFGPERQVAGARSA